MFMIVFVQVLMSFLTVVWAVGPTAGQELDRASLIEKAKREGQVAWYTTMGLQDAKPMADAFEKEYPGLKVSIYRGGGGVVLNKILNEARAQKYLFDVVTGRGEMILPLKKRGLIASYKSSEASFYDDDLKDSAGYWYVVYVNPWFLGYNTRLVKKGEVPKTYNDLLNLKWKGHKVSIGADDSAILLYGLVTAWGKEKAVRYFQELANQDPAMSRGSHTNRVQLLIAGEFPLTLSVGHTMQRFVVQGAPIDWIALEPVVVQMYPIMLASRALHPNAAKLFLDFVLSKKGQETIRGFHRIPARNGVDPNPPRLFKGFKRVVEDVDAHENFEEVIKLFEEIFKLR